MAGATDNEITVDIVSGFPRKALADVGVISVPIKVIITQELLKIGDAGRELKWQPAHDHYRDVVALAGGDMGAGQGQPLLLVPEGMRLRQRSSR